MPPVDVLNRVYDYVAQATDALDVAIDAPAPSVLRLTSLSEACCYLGQGVDALDGILLHPRRVAPVGDTDHDSPSIDQALSHNRDRLLEPRRTLDDIIVSGDRIRAARAAETVGALEAFDDTRRDPIEDVHDGLAHARAELNEVHIALLALRERVGDALPQPWVNTGSRQADT